MGTSECHKARTSYQEWRLIFQASVLGEGYGQGHRTPMSGAWAINPDYS
jgi:hypothetical protein